MWGCRMGKSEIEWTDKTWNPWSGCEKISQGCKFCYAAALPPSMRRRAVWGADAPRIEASEEYWRQPIAWDRRAAKEGVRRKVFCASVADIGEARPELDAWRDRALALVALTPNLDWLWLTKRPEYLAEYFKAPDLYIRVLNAANFFRSTPGRNGMRRANDRCGVAISDPTRELPRNLWVGTSVEDQATADARIPHLLRIPARVRFLSMEPLLGAVDVLPWLSRAAGLWKTPPESWGAVQWPEWVPSKIREELSSFWGVFGRKPLDYHKHVNLEQYADIPRFGTHTSESRSIYFSPGRELKPGRYVHAWNNMGRVVHEDGSYSVVHLGSRREFSGGRIDWVIVGGESGRSARPMHPQWARSIRDQCVSAGVPYFFKQWGEWAPGEAVENNGTDWLQMYEADDDGGAPVHDWADSEYRARVPDLADRRPGEVGGDTRVLRVTKKLAGRLLDGREWSEVPQ